MRQLLRRAWYAIRKHQFEADLAEELDFHRELKQREIEGRGASPTEASFATRRALGSIALAQDLSRDVWCPRWLQGIGQDMRLALRSLRGTPIVTTVAVVSLALGIGANTAIFSLVNGLLLRTLPVKDPARLVLVKGREPVGWAEWSYPVWEQIHHRPQLFDGALTWAPTIFNLAPGGETQFVEGLWVNGSFFEGLGVQPLLGRTLSDADDQRGGGPDGPVAVISYSFWQRHFGGAPDAIGRTLPLDRVAFTIVGVTPREFFGPAVGRAFDVIVPLGDEPLLRGRETWLEVSDRPWLTIMARLKPEQTVDTATAELRAVQAQIFTGTLPENWPREELDQYLKQTFRLIPAATGDSRLRGTYERPLLTIMVVVAIVLLIACANIANLLLARATARRHELSVRRALGASRWRLARQLLTESVLLASLGAAFGLVMASWGSHLLVRQLSTNILETGPSVTTNTVFLDLSIDWHVLAFTVGIALATALFFGVVPALHASGVAPMTALNAHGRATSAHTFGWTNGLLVAQVALSVVLVVAAGLFVRTFASLATRHVGFDRDHVLMVHVDTQRATVNPAQRTALYERVREAVRTVPGVAEAAVSLAMPVFSGPMMVVRIDQVSGDVELPEGDRRTSNNVISPGWFSTFGIPVLAGRDFTDRDRAGTPLVVVVNQAFARRFLNGASPLRHTVMANRGPLKPAVYQIVGVVADTVYGSLRDKMPPAMYVPIAQLGEEWSPRLASVNLSVRSTGASPAMLTKSVAAAIAEVNPQLALTFRPLADEIDASVTQERIVAMLSGFFGGLALLLAGLGLYGVTAYTVSRRRTEIGIRMALGAEAKNVQWLVLRETLLLVLIGVAIGLPVALASTRLISSQLFGLKPTDPLTIVAATFLLLAVAIFAGYLPARRASRVDPMVALRYE
jgi:putative ABC transport system permease protein